MLNGTYLRLLMLIKVVKIIFIFYCPFGRWFGQPYSLFQNYVIPLPNREANH